MVSILIKATKIFFHKKIIKLNPKLYLKEENYSLKIFRQLNFLFIYLNNLYSIY